MLKLTQSRTALIFLSTTLAVTGVSCGINKPTTFGDTQPVATRNLPGNLPSSTPSASSKRTTPPAKSKPKKAAPVSSQSNSYALALDKASSASIISQSAQSPDDWNAVVGQWSDALALMKAVPASSPYTAIARTKIAEYQQNLAYAKQQAQSTGGVHGNVVAAVPAPASDPGPVLDNVDTAPTSSPGVFQVPIKRRAGGTPVIDVTFNSTRQFEMIVDTGASGTVITQQMADALSLVPVGKAKANTASAKAVEFTVAYVESIEVGGAVIKNVPVAIAGPELETGLLGHDFFSNYDVTIKRDVVEFRPR